MNREAIRRSWEISVADVEAQLAAYGVRRSEMDAVLVILELFAERNHWIVPRSNLAELWGAIDWSRYEIDASHEGLAIADALQRKFVESARESTQRRQLYQLTARAMRYLQERRDAAAASA